MTDLPRPIKVIKRADIPELKKNEKLGEVKLTKWKKLNVDELRKEWLAECQEKKKREHERDREVFADTSSGTD